MFTITLDDGPYTVFKSDGDVAVYRTKAKLVKAIGWRTLSRRLDEARPVTAAAWLKAQAAVAQTGYAELFGYTASYGPRYLVLNDFGEALAVADFAKEAPAPYDKSFGNYGVRHSGSRRRGYSHWLRVPRTQSECRMNALVVEEDGEVAARPCRHAPLLPSAWEDLPRTVQRSWKEHRRFQHHAA